MRWVGILAFLAACGGGDDGPDARPDGRRVDGVFPVPGGWYDGPAVPGGPVQETAVVATRDGIYVIGGFAGLEITDAVRIYDPGTRTWRDGPRLPAPVHHATATVHRDTIYVLGMLETGSFAASGAAWAYTPGTDTNWRIRTSMPSGSERGAAVAGSWGTLILVAGGFRGGAVDSALLYDPIGDLWIEDVPPLPEARDHACGGSSDDTVYVVGGRVGGTADVRSTVFAFDGDSWTERTAMPTGRGGTACGIVAGELIVVGGEGNGADPSGVFPQAEAYSFTSDSWRTLDPMPHPRHGMGAAGSGASLYVPGGADVAGFGAVDTFEILTP